MLGCALNFFFIISLVLEGSPHCPKLFASFCGAFKKTGERNFFSVTNK